MAKQGKSRGGRVLYAATNIGIASVVFFLKFILLQEPLPVFVFSVFAYALGVVVLLSFFLAANRRPR